LEELDAEFGVRQWLGEAVDEDADAPRDHCRRNSGFQAAGSYQGYRFLIDLPVACQDARDEISARLVPQTTRNEEPLVFIARVASQPLLYAGQALIGGCLLVDANAPRAGIAATPAGALALESVVIVHTVGVLLLAGGGA
jgi:hypothetical protein